MAGSCRIKSVLLRIVAVCIVSCTMHGRSAAMPAADSLRGGISVRTNLLWSAASSANLGLEVPVSSHWTLGANAGLKTWPRWFLWDNDRTDAAKWKHLAIVPEARWWKGGIYDGLFLSGDLIYTHYNVGGVKFPLGLYPETAGSRLQGDFLGIGVGAGYSWRLSGHWRLEAEAGLGAGYSASSRYECSYCGRKIADERGPVLVPKLGLNIAYNFERRKAREKVIEVINTPQPPVDTIVPPVEVPVPQEFAPPLVLVAVRPNRGIAGELMKTSPILRPATEYRPYTPDRILRKEEGPLMVFFELDKVRLLRSFREGDYLRDNSPVLDSVINITKTILKDSVSRVSKIQIVGLASVEGRVAHNVWLSENRALALQKYIQERVPVSDDMFESVGGGEAWSEFRDQISDILRAGGSEELSASQARMVLDIIDGEPDPDRRERSLKSLEGGRLYRTLLERILKVQRNSGYIRIYFDWIPDRTAKSINDGIDLLKEGRYEEALRAIEKQKDDPRAANAWALALYYNGRMDEALSVLEKASAGGDEAAARNYMQLQETIRQNAAYSKYKEELEKYKQQHTKLYAY